MERSIWTYARHGHLEGLRELLSSEAECRVDEADDFGATPLMVSNANQQTMPPPHCCSLFVLTVVSYFLWPSRSSTQHAATHGQEAAVLFLLDVGASTSLQDVESGYSALHRAFLCCKLSTAAALVRSGASVHTPRDHEVRPRARAILNLRAHAPTPALGGLLAALPFGMPPHLLLLPAATVRAFASSGPLASGAAAPSLGPPHSYPLGRHATRARRREPCARRGRRALHLG